MGHLLPASRRPRDRRTELPEKRDRTRWRSSCGARRSLWAGGTVR